MTLKPHHNGTVRRAIAWLTACATGLLVLTHAQAEIPSTMLWNEASAARLQVVFPGNAYNASWQFRRCRCGDVLVNSDSSLPGESRQGDMLMVENRAVIYRGFDSERPEEVMSIDAPALMIQLAFQLLERALPAGPAAASSKAYIDIGSSEEPVTLDTGQAAGSFFAPWSVKGKVAPIRGDELQFELHFTFNATPPGTGPEQSASMDLSGSFDYVLQEFPVSDDRALDDLRLVWRDLNDPAINGAENIATLGELRDHIKANPQTR